MDIHISAQHPAFAGHFPGQPLLPGVSLLSEVLEAVLRDPALAALVGPRPKLGAVKFLAPVRPGAALTLSFAPTATSLRFEVRLADCVAASGHFERAT